MSLSDSPKDTELLGSKIDKLATFMLEKKELEIKLKETESMIATIQKDLIESMDTAQIGESVSSSGHKVVIAEETVPHVDPENWDQVYAFIHDNNYYHLLQKRLSVTAYREFLNMGKPVPGVLPYTTRKIKFKGA
jgi:hypothetical protein